MSRREMQRRLVEEAERAGVMETGNVQLFVLSREDFDGMPPLNTEAGQAWMDVKIEETKPDLAIFDNIQALVAGDQRDEDSWTPVLPWVSSLTKRRIGQIWLHHTGHNEGHGYGTKTREWKMDTCIMMKRVDSESDDLMFTIEFTKARERRPDNRDEFRTATIRLRDDKWEIVEGVLGPKTKGQALSDAAKIALKMLRRASDQVGEAPPASNHIPHNARVVRESLWRKYCYDGGITISDEQEAKKKAFQRACESLLSRELIGKWQEYVWLTR
jgi:hypothetical protein